MQLQPLKLKDKLLEQRLLSHHEKFQRLKKQLGKIMDRTASPVAEHFNSIRRVL